MPDTELVQHGARVMTVCNACRYCEQYCPVFPAMERRLTFTDADLAYLANLCHNCGECLYACQYAPPHEFGINVPRTLDALRRRSYEQHWWPRSLGAALNARSTLAAVTLAAVTTVVLLVGATLGGSPLTQSQPGGNFYLVMPYIVMVVVFGATGAFVLIALVVGATRFARDLRDLNPVVPARSRLRALRDALTLRHLHGSGVDCTTALDVRRPWRRWFHHATFYGFMLCFASTSVAAVYHDVFGWRAPYDYVTLPVVLGMLGGTGLLAGTTGLLLLRRRRDPLLTEVGAQGADEAFLLLLWLAGVTGLALLALRTTSVMGLLLMMHLGVVLALFLTLPYGKFVHGIYRLIALRKFHSEG